MVHPWLLRSRGDILEEKGMPDQKALSVETEMMVNYNAPDRVKVCERENWIKREGKRPTQALLDAMRGQQARDDVSWWS